MSFKTLANAGDAVNFNAEQDGAYINALSCGSDFIIKGIGNEFQITYSATSLQITIGTGEAVICGRTVRADDANNFVLNASDTKLLVLRTNLSSQAGSETSLAATTENLLQRENLNSGGSQHDLVLAEITTNASGVTSVTDKRVIRNSPIPYGTSLPATANEGDIFLLYTVE